MKMPLTLLHTQAPPAAYDFDVIGHPRSDFRFAVVLPFHPYTDGRRGGQVTVCKEFAQGVVAMMFTLPAGGFDPARHATLAECAAAEMNEEVRASIVGAHLGSPLDTLTQRGPHFDTQAQLVGGQLLPLLPLDLPGIPESKWCANRFHPFLCIDPQPDPTPPPRDAEEFMEVGVEIGVADR